MAVVAIGPHTGDYEVDSLIKVLTSNRDGVVGTQLDLSAGGKLEAGSIEGRRLHGKDGFSQTQSEYDANVSSYGASANGVVRAQYLIAAAKVA